MKVPVYMGEAGTESRRQVGEGQVNGDAITVRITDAIAMRQLGLGEQLEVSIGERLQPPVNRLHRD